MTIFKIKKDVKPIVAKEDLYTEVYQLVKARYPTAEIIKLIDGPHWDMLIIIGIIRDTKKMIGAFHHESLKTEQLQLALAVTLEDSENFFTPRCVGPYHMVNTKSAKHIMKWLEEND